MFKTRSAKLGCAVASALALGVAASLSVADSFTANRTTVQPGETLELTYTATQANSQDVYLAFMLDGTLLFMDAGGGFSAYAPGAATPARLKAPAAGSHTLLTFTMPEGFFKNVTVYQAAGKPGADLLVPGNYDPASLHSLNLSFVPAAVTPAPAANGRALYATHCAACHGANPKDNKYNTLKGVNPQATLDAIKKDSGGMGYLTLSNEEHNAIAAWIANPV